MAEIIISPFANTKDTREIIRNAVLKHPNSDILIVNEDMGESFEFNTGIHDMQHIINTALESIEDFQKSYDEWIKECEEKCEEPELRYA